MYQAERVRRVAASPELMWALLTDTNRWDRVAGAGPTEYRYDQLDPNDASTRTRVGSAFMLGARYPWTEHGEWIEGRLAWGERHYLAGPVNRAGYRVELEPEAGATSVRLSAYVGDDVPTPLGVAMRAHFEGALERWLDSIERLIARLGPLPDLTAPGADGAAAEPLAAQARRLLMSAPAAPEGDLHGGQRSPVREQEFAFRTLEFRKAPVSAEVRERLIWFLHDRPDDEVREIRPYECARAWELPRRDVLSAFLHAARAGLVDLRWQLDCPVCRVAADRRGTLAEVGKQAHCDECELDFAVDFARNVEAVFSVNPAVRTATPALYCGGSPWLRPHVFALFELAPGERREVAVKLPPGPLVLRVPGGGRAEIDAPPSRLVVRLDGSRVVALGEGDAGGVATMLLLDNPGPRQRAVIVERAGWSADRVTGAAVVAFPEFLDLFATEAPATGVDLSIGAITILFSDLTGTTALYERLGDARAFALVQEHFSDTSALIAEHGGALVKTMGDAVMASFSSPGDALRAGLAMIGSVQQLAARAGLPPEEVALKVGVHHGPCLAVRANDRLDFFGTTVNIASRLQCQARRDQVVVLAELTAHPEIAATLRTGYRVERFRAQLKGLRATQTLVSIDQAPATPPLAEAAPELEVYVGW